MLSTEMKERLIAAGLTKNQAASVTAETIVDYAIVDYANNAGYVTYAYLGGQAKRDIHYDKPRDDYATF